MKLPRFFNVDGLPVKLVVGPVPGTTRAVRFDGGKFPVVKVLEEGAEITEDEFNRLTDNKNLV